MTIMKNAIGKEHSATHDCYLRLRQMILTGAVAPGAKLKIEDLRQQLQSGASPVREALSLLTSDLLVERLDQRGFRSAPISKENFEEILRLRCSLEDMALRASIGNATEAWEEALVLSYHRMVRAKKQGGPDVEITHKDFHLALLANAKMPTLLRYCNQLYDLNIRYRFLASEGPGYGKRSIATEHEAIFNAAIDRDADAASDALMDHYHKTGRYLSHLIEA